jgi:hypothetical protein
MACTVNHAKLVGLTFCEECGQKVGRTDWVCTSGHEVEAQFKFCLICGKGETTSKARPRNEYKPSVVSKDTDPEIEYAVRNQGLYSPVENTNKALNTPVKIMIGVLGVFVLGLIFLGIRQSAVPQFTDVTVSMTIVNESCYDLNWGYGDIPGGQVVVTADGAQVGFGAYSVFGDDVALGCRFEAFIPGVPMDAENYSVSMASGRRGVIYNTKSELEANGWAFELSMG